MSARRTTPALAIARLACSRRRRCSLFAFATLLLLFVAAGAAASPTSAPVGRQTAPLGRQTAPIGVAPGDAIDPRLASACTSFHWSSSPGDLRFELVVYAVDETTADDALGSSEVPDVAPALSVKLPGAASSWTPPLDQCLPAGASYAWSVRAFREDGASSWATPLFFRVPEWPTPEEIARALDVLRVAGARAPAQHGTSEPEQLASAVAERAVPRRTERAGVILPPVTPVYSGGGPASLRVGGEARTVDPTGEPRLWGQGRPGAKVYGRDDGSGAFCAAGSIRFGLSDSVAPWDSAEAVCPEGTWVCRVSEVEAAPACDTGRPNTTADVYSCDGVSDDTTVLGWLADHAPSPNSSVASTLNESGGVSGLHSCYMAPVWCCFD